MGTDRNQPQHPSADSRLKVHLRLVQVGAMRYRLVTLRPGTDACFSTNYYHDTWHIVSDMAGARLLARLLWGLSYQRQHGTMVLVHGRHLAPTPFEAERSDPFLLIPSHLTSPDARAFRTLKQLLPRLGPPDMTIRWLTFGLDAVLQAWQEGSEHATAERDWQTLWKDDKRHLRWQERMGRVGGFICYCAPPPILRQQALAVHSLRVWHGGTLTGMDYHYLAEHRHSASWCDGEVQVFADYRERLAAATQARQEILALPNQQGVSEELQEAISLRRDQIKRRRRRNRSSMGRHR